MMGLKANAAQRTGIDAGFSLMELLVSLTLLAMTLALLPGAFRTGKRGWDTSAQLEIRAASDITTSFLRQRLAEATPLFDRDASGRSRLAFAGRPQDLNFVAPAPSGPLGGGLYRYGVALELGQSQGADALILSMTPFRQLGVGDQPPASKHVLMPAVQSFAISYFGVVADGGAPVWSDNWPREDRLPDLIELHAVSSQAGTRPLGPLRVELKLRPTSPP